MGWTGGRRGRRKDAAQQLWTLEKIGSSMPISKKHSDQLIVRVCSVLVIYIEGTLRSF